MSKKRAAVWWASGSLVLAALAFIPSAAAFTPAIGLSLLALVSAVGAASLGAWRISTLAIVLVGATVLVSPAFFPREDLVRVEHVFAGAPIAVVLLGVVLYLHYLKHAKDT